jgi:hypothetical protein
VDLFRPRVGVERLEVWWPASGERQAWTGLAADTVVRIVEPR